MSGTSCACDRTENKHNSRLFSKLYKGAKKMFTFGFDVKCLADSANDSSKVKQDTALRQCNTSNFMEWKMLSQIRRA